MRVRSGGFSSKDFFKGFLRIFKLICLCFLPFCLDSKSLWEAEMDMEPIFQ